VVGGEDGYCVAAEALRAKAARREGAAFELALLGRKALEDREGLGVPWEECAAGERGRGAAAGDRGRRGSGGGGTRSTRSRTGRVGRGGVTRRRCRPGRYASGGGWRFCRWHLAAGGDGAGGVMAGGVARGG
jgi:hypothetical protein